MTKPTEHDLYLFGLDPIISQCPLDFGDGGMWTAVAARCNKCGQPVDADMFRGMVGRTDENTFALDAVAACNECRIVTPVGYQLHNHRRVTGVKDGIIAIWGGPPSLAERLFQKVSRLLRP